MTTEQKLHILQQWQDNYTRIDQVMEDLQAVVGLEPESRLHEAVWMLFGDYTHTVERLLGDENQSLDWFCYDNEMGRKQLSAGIPGFMRPICTLEDLLWLIDLEGSSND